MMLHSEIRDPQSMSDNDQLIHDTQAGARRRAEFASE